MTVDPAHELPITDARVRLADVVNDAAYGGTVTYLTRHGRRVAAVVPSEAAEAMERAEDEYLSALADDAATEIAAGAAAAPLAQVRAELGL